MDYVLPPNVREQYVMSGRFESPEMMNVQLSSRVCSFGKQVVERNQVCSPPRRCLRVFYISISHVF